MMTSRRQNLFIGSVGALLFGVLCWISFDFMHSVQQSLWDNSVKNIMESTARGANVLQRGYVKDLEMLRMLASELEQGKSSDSGRIRSKLKTFLSGGCQLNNDAISFQLPLTWNLAKSAIVRYTISRVLDTTIDFLLKRANQCLCLPLFCSRYTVCDLL